MDDELRQSHERVGNLLDGLKGLVGPDLAVEVNAGQCAFHRGAVLLSALVVHAPGEANVHTQFKRFLGHLLSPVLLLQFPAAG